MTGRENDDAESVPQSSDYFNGLQPQGDAGEVRTSFESSRDTQRSIATAVLTGMLAQAGFGEVPPVIPPTPEQ